MVYTIKKENIEKIMIFDNSKLKYSLNKIQEKTGCTTIINGGFFNMSTMKPVTHLKVDGVVKAKDEYKYWGYAFNTNSKKFDMVNEYSLYDNYFCGVAMVKDKVATGMYYNADVEGKRARTAIGQMPNGDIVIYCGKEGTSEAIAPKKLQEYFINLGVKDGIMLDGGGSTQCILGNKKSISSTRIVANLILIWEKDGTIGNTSSNNSGSSNINTNTNVSKPNTENNSTNNNSSSNTNTSTNNSNTTTNTKTEKIDMPDFNKMWKPIYAEPAIDQAAGSTGDGVKWVQAMLQKIGFLISVNGTYNTETVNAVKKFQKYWSLTSGGVAGPATRKGLKECVWGITGSEKELVRVAMAEICRNEAEGQDDKYISWYNAKMKTNFAMSVSWCAIFVSWCMNRAGIDSTKFPYFSSCTAGLSKFKALGYARDPKTYNPKSGDIIFFDFNKIGTPQHVGFVFAVDEQYVYTIEGNSSDAVKHNKYLRTSPSILKYVDLQSQF